MTSSSRSPNNNYVDSFEAFMKLADYSLMNNLNADPASRPDGSDHHAREVHSGHYVQVTPTPLPKSEYVAHSRTFFDELGLSHDLALDHGFRRLFSGDISAASAPMRRVGWATGYALSIYGPEYTEQCPFGTGNGYGDGRAISVFEGVINGRRLEMQLKAQAQRLIVAALTDALYCVQVCVSF